MANDAPAEKSLSNEEVFNRKSERRAKLSDPEELERRVHMAELRAREAEAELRYLEATFKHRALKSQGKERRQTRSNRKKAKKGAAASED